MTAVRTQWIVIDGAPSSGKTTLVTSLHGRGFRIVPEVARAYIEFELSKGRTLEDIRGATQTFQDDVVKFHFVRQRTLNPAEKMILDGGLPDATAYIRLHKLIGERAVMEESAKHIYRQVFLLDSLPFVHDHVRTENAEMAVFIDRTIEEAYRELGYEPIRIPVMPVEERVAFLLERMMEQEPSRKPLKEHVLV